MTAPTPAKRSPWFYVSIVLALVCWWSTSKMLDEAAAADRNFRELLRCGCSLSNVLGPH